MQFCSIVNAISNHCWNQVTRSSQLRKFATILALFILQSGSDYEICLFIINGLRARPHQLAAIVENTNRMLLAYRTKVHDDMFLSKRVAKLGYNVFIMDRKVITAWRYNETPIAVRRGFPARKRSVIMAEIPSRWAASR